MNITIFRLVKTAAGFDLQVAPFYFWLVVVLIVLNIVLGAIAPRGRD